MGWMLDKTGFMGECPTGLLEEVLKAQARKLLRWGLEQCQHQGSPTPRNRFGCEKCMTALQGELRE